MSQTPKPSPARPRRTSDAGNARADAILEGAAAVFSAQGFAATSMRQVARRTGASLGSIYYHFESKEDLLRALICDNFRRVLESLQARLEGVEDPAEALRVFIDNHIRFFARHLPEMRVMSHELDTLTGKAGREVSVLRQQYMRAARDRLAALRPDLDDRQLRIDTLCLFGMLNWTYRWFHTVDVSADADAIGTRMTELFLHGFVRTS